jgi:hypothetical protein
MECLWAVSVKFWDQVGAYKNPGMPDVLRTFLQSFQVLLFPKLSPYPNTTPQSLQYQFPSLASDPGLSGLVPAELISAAHEGAGRNSMPSTSFSPLHSTSHNEVPLLPRVNCQVTDDTDCQLGLGGALRRPLSSNSRWCPHEAGCSLPPPEQLWVTQYVVRHMLSTDPAQSQFFSRPNLLINSHGSGQRVYAV